ALYSSSEKVACMVGHEREAGRHYLKERLPTAGVGWFRLNQCFPRSYFVAFVFFVAEKKF
ncbi:hypothetical protein, partial [Rhodocyclus purpureus]|uniref:hypothetical protein n=1 Tax=Rhodocyclus purpureus TaxID=1067 RepID=UPI001A92A68F